MCESACTVERKYLCLCTSEWVSVSFTPCSLLPDAQARAHDGLGKLGPAFSHSQRGIR